MFGGEIEVDESYFGGKWKNKLSLDVTGVCLKFGLLKLGCKD
jgi:hypothetical protein